MISPAALLSASSIVGGVINRLTSFRRSKPPALPINNGVGNDSLAISPQAFEQFSTMQANKTFSSIIDSPRTGDTKSLFEIKQDFQENFADFQAQLGDFFQSAGIDTSQEIILQPDGKGHIRSVGDNPNGQAINNLLDENNPLTARLMVLAARASLLNAAETEPGFKAAFQSDPRNAIKTFLPALKKRLLGFQLRIKDGQMTPAFAGADKRESPRVPTR